MMYLFAIHTLSIGKNHRLSNLKPSRNNQLQHIVLFLLFIQLFSLNANAQSIAKNKIIYKGSLFSINMEIGFAFPLIKGNSSLDILSFPTNPEPVINFTETKIFDQQICSAPLIGLEALYKIRPDVSIGLSSQFRSSYNYNSNMLFTQDKKVVSNDLTVSSFGEFSQESNIRNTTLSAVVYFSVFRFNLSKSQSALFELGFGGGASFYKITSTTPHVLLKMYVHNDYVDGSYVLGPGNILPKTIRSTSYTWQISTNLVLLSACLPDIKIGFRVSSLGSFTIMKSQEGMNQLFKLTSTNTGSQDQELALLSTNKPREIITKEIFVRFYLW